MDIYKIERKQIDPLNTTLKIVYLIDLTNITYIAIHDISRSENGGSILLKLASTPINL